VRWHYRLRLYRIIATNVRAGGNEIDLIARRGRKLVFCEVKSKGGEDFGDPLEAVGPTKARRVRRAAEAWLATRPECARLDASFEVVGVRGGSVTRVPLG
jgi:putative endonuclease